MNQLQKLACTSCLLLAFSLPIGHVQAAENSAEEYYQIICGYGYSQPYDALNVLSQAHVIYPKDQRFIKEINARAKVVLDWSRGSHLNGKYDGAIYGCNIILKTDGVSQNIKNEANILLTLSKRGEKGIEGRFKLPEYFNLSEDYQQKYIKSGYQYQSIGYYDSFDNYLSIENVSSYTDQNIVRFDPKGIPMVKYYDNFYYNPVTIDQYALSYYNIYLRDKNNSKENKYMKQQFLNAADWLIDNMDSSGAFRYSFNYKHYLDENELQPGWISAMAQGQALSVFARAYHLTWDRKYIDAGNAVFKFLVTKTSDGGAMDNLGSLNPSLEDYIFFQLYVTSPPSYTLNGHMYTLMGLYDWSNISNNKEISEEAKTYFDKGLDTVKYILPYYDIGGFVTYDLGFLTKPGIKPTINFDYYGSHLTLLDAFYLITKDETFSYYRNLWTSYIEKY